MRPDRITTSTSSLLAPRMILGVLLIALICGCPDSKPSVPPTPAPTAVAEEQPSGRSTGLRPAAVGPAEVNRDDPEYVAIRTAFAQAKSAYAGGNYRALFGCVVPASRFSLLNRLAREAERIARSGEQRSNLKEILERHQVPEAAQGRSPSAWSSVADPAGAFFDLMKWFADLLLEVDFIDETFAGEPRVFELSHATVRVHVSLPGLPVTDKTPWRRFEKIDGNWYMLLE